MSILSEPNNVFQEKINNLFKKKSSSEVDILFNIIDLLFYNSVRSTDLCHLYKSLDLENFIKVCSIVDGREIKIPTKEEIEDLLITSLIYYDKEINGYDWQEIKEKYSEFNISSIKFSFKIKKLNEFIKSHLKNLYKELEAKNGKLPKRNKKDAK